MRFAKVLALSFLVALPVAGQDVVLARNAWTVVTKADFDAEISRIPASEQFEFLASAERVARTVEAIILNKTLAAQARASKLDESAEVKAEIRSSTDKVLARHRLLQAEAELKVPDFSKRVEELYKANPGKYAEKDVYHAKHILIDLKCRTKEAAEKRAAEALAELKAGAAFEDVAKKFSDDPSVKMNGGDLGKSVLANLTPTFAEALKSMKVGQLSEPVLSNFGYHVIKLEGLQKGRQFRFEEVRESLMKEVKDEWLKQQRKLLVDAITADPGLKLDLDAIQALKTNIGERPGSPSSR